MPTRAGGKYALMKTNPLKTWPAACVAALLLLPLIASAAPETARTIVAFGDSTTALRDTIDQVYADRLPLLLAERGITARVINSGVGGSHTGRLADNPRHKRRHALERFQDAVRDHDPDIVVIQFGWNDSYVDEGGVEGASRIPLEAYEANLRHMIKVLGEDGSRVVLMTPNRPRSDFEAWRFERTERYVIAVRKLAAETDAALVDVWAAYAEYAAGEGRSIDDLLLDAVHPNDKGHALVARLLVEPLVALLDAAGAPKGLDEARPR